MPGTAREGYSAKVDIRLHVAGLNLDVAQVSRQFLILREPCAVVPGTAGQVIVTIDDREQIYPVVFHEGITPQSRRANFS